MRYILLLSVFALFVLSEPAFAQFNTPVNNGPIITISPQYPAPGDRITATLEDLSGVVNQSTITWKLNSLVMPEVSNARSITFTAGEALVTQTIEATLEPRAGTKTTVRESITPRLLDIVIEPQTYVPSEYAGRALPTYGSQVRAVALLHGKNTLENADGYSYLWKLNNTVINGGPQRGASSILYTVPYGKKHTISVEIIDTTNNKILARRGITVPVGEISLALYESSTLYGRSQHIMTDPLLMIAPSITLAAVPYFLDLRVWRGNPYTAWKIDGRQVSGKDNPYELTVTRTGQGRSDIEFEVRNLNELLQGGKVDTTIAF